MSVSSADPDALRRYAGRAGGALADLADAAHLVRRAVAAVQSALPDGFKLAGPTDLALPAIGRARAVDALVATTAEAFERAGRGGGRPVTVQDSALPALRAVYDAATVDALAGRLAGELASLRERRAAGAGDGTTPAELAGLLVMARALLGPAAGAGADAAGAARAAEALIDHMGPGDLSAILAMLEAGVLAGGRRSPSAAGLADLAVVLSLGLEGRPARAEGWVRALTRGHPWHGGPPEALVAVAALGAPTARTLGLAVWAEAGRPRPGTPGSPVTPRDARPGGLLDTMFGTTHAPQVIVRGAVDRPALANGIVRAARGEAFEELFGHGYRAHRRPRSLASDLDALLPASVDAALPLDDRLRAALGAMRAVEQAGDLDRTYRAATLANLGAMSHPLLAHLGADGGTIVLASAPGADTTESADPLWGAAARLGTTDPGAVGLRTALDRASDDLVARAVTGSRSEPLDLQTLGRLRRVRELMVATVAGGHLDAVEQRIGRAGSAPTPEAALLRLLGATPAEPVTVLVDVVDGYRRAHAVDVVAGGSVLGPRSEAEMTHRLVLANLAARPDLASHELVEALAAAALEGLADDDRRSAAVGIYDFVAGDHVDEASHPGLAELRDLLARQHDVMNLGAAEITDHALG